MFEICGSLYQKAGGTLSELQTFRTLSTIEQTLQDAIDTAWTTLGLGENDDGFEVKADDDGSKGEVFALFATGIKFGSVAQHFTNDYGAKPIKSIVLTGGKGYPQIDWNFDD